MNKTRIGIFVGLCIGALVAACDDSPPEGTPTTNANAQNATGTSTSTGPGPGSGGAGGAGGAPDCFMNPMTHEEIINACTDAEQVDKQPVLPHLNPDGSLPPIP